MKEQFWWSFPVSEYLPTTALHQLLGRFPIALTNPTEIPALLFPPQRKSSRTPEPSISPPRSRDPAPRGYRLPQHRLYRRGRLPGWPPDLSVGPATAAFPERPRRVRGTSTGTAAAGSEGRKRPGAIRVDRWILGGLQGLGGVWSHWDGVGSGGLDERGLRRAAGIGSAAAGVSFLASMQRGSDFRSPGMLFAWEGLTKGTITPDLSRADAQVKP